MKEEDKSFLDHGSGASVSYTDKYSLLGGAL